MQLIAKDRPVLTIQQRDQRVVEAALPIHMMYLMYELMTKKGWNIREDILRNLNMAGLIPFQSLDELSISRCAKKTDDAAKALLHDLSPDDARHGLMDTAAFCLLLANEQFIDPTSMPVLVALALMDEMETGSDWEYTQRQAYANASRLLGRARLLNHYMRPQNLRIVEGQPL